MQKESLKFPKDYSRDLIQKHLDLDIFNKNTPKEDILQYIEHPQKVIEKKYEECFEQSWNAVTAIFAGERAWL